VCSQSYLTCAETSRRFARFLCFSAVVHLFHIKFPAFQLLQQRRHYFILVYVSCIASPWSFGPHSSVTPSFVTTNILLMVLSVCPFLCYRNYRGGSLFQSLFLVTSQNSGLIGARVGVAAGNLIEHYIIRRLVVPLHNRLPDHFR
jgi:hypothetical protein